MLSISGRAEQATLARNESGLRRAHAYDEHSYRRLREDSIVRQIGMSFWDVDEGFEKVQASLA